MRHIRIAFLWLLVLAACSDQPTGFDNSPSALIVGDWQLLHSSGGFTGRMSYPGEGVFIIKSFSDDGFYVQTLNDSVTASGEYSIQKDKTIYSLDSLDVIVVKNVVFPKMVIRYLTRDSLLLSDGAHDGYSSLFKRLD